MIQEEKNMKRMLAALLVLVLPCVALAAPWIEETEYHADGSLAWRATCFADELPPLLTGIVQEETISGASVEIPANQLAMAVLTAVDGRTLAYVQECGGAWSCTDLSGVLSGSVGLHDRQGTYPAFCVFNAYRSQEPTWHVDYLDGQLHLTPYTPQEHQALTGQ